MNRYLSQNSIPWLFEKSDPEIRYLAMRDIFPEESSAEELSEAYGELYSSEDIQSVLMKSDSGILGDKDHFDIFYRGSMWSFAEAIVRGLDRREKKIEATADYLCRRCQKETGGFTLNWKPELEVSCRTGDMVRCLIQAGFNDERVDKGIAWIRSHQRHDGGWLHCPLSDAGDLFSLMLLRKSGKGLERENNKDIPSCLYATVSCLMALELHDEKNNLHKESVKTGVEFLLSRRLFASDQQTQMHICYKGRSADLSSLGYPVMTQYDILYGLLAVARAGFLNDPRTGEAFNNFISKQNEDGTWGMENFSAGMLLRKKRRNNFHRQKSKWVTLNSIRLFKYMGLA